MQMQRHSGGLWPVGSGRCPRGQEAKRPRAEQEGGGVAIAQAKACTLCSKRVRSNQVLEGALSSPVSYLNIGRGYAPLVHLLAVASGHWQVASGKWPLALAHEAQSHRGQEAQSPRGHELATIRGGGES